MRVSKEEKAASHVRIVEMAENLFKSDGIEGTGVAAVMQAAGLTHGGFYRHFSSKEDLVCAALEKSYDDIVQHLERLFAQKGAKAALTEYVESYLSNEHMTDPGRGCPIAALGIEAARGSIPYKTVMARGRDRIVELLSQGFSGDEAEKQQKASALLATLVGAIILARASPSQSVAEDVLAGARRAVLADL